MAWQWGQRLRPAATTASCARRLRVRALLCLRLGSGIGHPLSKQVQGSSGIPTLNNRGVTYSNFRKASSRGSAGVSLQLQVAWFRFAPQRGHRPRQSSRQRG